MFDQLVKRSNWVWIYKTGRFAEERRAFLCELPHRVLRGHWSAYQFPPANLMRGFSKESQVTAAPAMRY